MAEDLGSRWAAAMRRGDFAEAWAVSDAVMRTRPATAAADQPRHLQLVWDGTPLDGQRVLIRCYHGLGDTIQFIRYAPLVRAIAREVIVWAQPELIPLLQTAAGVDRIEPLHAGVPAFHYDVDVECMELPYIFRSTPATVPAGVPYLHVDPAPRVGDGDIRIGLVARAGDWDRLRSIPTELLTPIGEVRGTSVQLLHPAAESSGVPGIGVATGTDTVLGTARLMRSLNLVISVDSMPAHLAGALGVPVWTLLRHGADWRWVSNRDDSPWYPTMRLVWQEQPGAWEPVVEQVVQELEAMRDAVMQDDHRAAVRAEGTR